MHSSADHTQWLFARGNSMRPFFRSGDLIVFVPCPVEDVRKGDVIIFIPPGQKERVVHRVVSTGPDGIRTKGDANHPGMPGRQRHLPESAASVS